MNNVRAGVNPAAVGRILRALTRGDSDRLGASQADLAELIAGAGVGNHRFDALVILRVCYDGAASHHNARDSLDDIHPVGRLVIQFVAEDGVRQEALGVGDDLCPVIEHRPAV